MNKVFSYQLPAFRLSIILLLASCFLLLSLLKPVFAQTAPDNINYQPVDTTNVSPTSPLYTDLVISNLFHSFGCIATGSSPIGQPCLTYQVIKDSAGVAKNIPMLSGTNFSGGLLGSMSSIMEGLYANKPINTTEYLSSIGKDFGMIKEAHAQVVGTGELVLNPVLKLWQVSRNIVYVIMVIIFVVVGLMVMFRQKLNPQTVITAQAALPGLVIGLIMITFSYFLAALITDTAFLGTNLIGAYFQAAQPPSSSSTELSLVEKTANENVLTIMGKLMRGIKKDDTTNGVASFFQAMGEPKNFIDLGFPPSINVDDPAKLIRTGVALTAYQLGSVIGPAIGAVIAGLGCGAASIPALATIIGAPVAAGGWIACVGIGNTVGGPAVGALIAGQTLNDPPAIVGFGIWIVAILAILYAMLQLLMKLIRNFLSIIFLTITAPFHFLAASLPGRQGMATTWILNMLCNVLVFPAVMAVFYFVNYLLGPVENSPFTVGSVSNFSPTVNLPLFGGLDTGFIRLLLAFGALTGTPAIPDIVCQAIGRIGKAGAMLGQEAGAAFGGGRKYVGQAQGGISGIQKDVSGFGGLRDQTIAEIDQFGNPTGGRKTAGLWTRVGMKWGEKKP